jgi:hypothetical protein
LISSTKKTKALKVSLFKKIMRKGGILVLEHGKL